MHLDVSVFVCVCLSVYVCLSVCPVHALTFECYDLETSLLVCGYIFRISRPVLYIKVFGSSSEQKMGYNSITKCEHSPVVSRRWMGNLLLHYL